jgi:hypothetical protein
VAIFIYTLTASPCGTGTVIFMSLNSSSGEPNSSSTGKWEIVAGTGSGDLVNVSGHGTTTISPDLSSADYEGEIFCNAS